MVPLCLSSCYSLDQQDVFFSSCETDKLTLFAVSKDEWDKDEDTEECTGNNLSCGFLVSVMAIYWHQVHNKSIHWSKVVPVKGTNKRISGSNCCNEVESINCIEMELQEVVSAGVIVILIWFGVVPLWESSHPQIGMQTVHYGEGNLHAVIQG